MTQERVIERIRKLLALAGDAGATEAEAALASSKAAELMEEHGLEIAAVELAGGEGEKRDLSVTGVRGLGREDWAIKLMNAVAESCFCNAEAKRNFHGSKMRLVGFSVIGRHSAVISCVQLFEYLSRTTIRLSRAEEGSQRYFRFGCAERLAERLSDRYERRLREQRAEQEKRQAEMRNAPGNGTALVVVLEDYAQKESDLNNDHRYNLPAGTTAARRATEIVKRQERDRQMDELQAQGISWDIAWWMVNYGKTKEEAEALEARSEKDRKKFRFRDRVDFDERRRMSSSYQSGRSAGNDIGLDDQVTDKKQRRIT